MWEKLSLTNKFKLINAIAAVIIVIVVMISVAASIKGMQGFGNELKQNETSRAFGEAIEEEGKAFKSYIEDEKAEAMNALQRCDEQTQTALEALPFDYHSMTLEQYTQTQAIRNSYESYKKLQNQILNMSSENAQYKSSISEYYKMQSYLESYAAKLESLTVNQGIITYKEQKNLFVIIPIICMLSGGVVLLAFFSIKIYLQKNILKPVVVLSKEAKRISQNDFSGQPLTMQGEDEMAVLVRSFEEMKLSTQSYITSMQEKHKMEKQMADLRFEMLKNQINPHFLFNTLNLIAGTAEIEDATTTEKMIVTLSRLFRYNLKSQTTVMPLGQELKIIEDYMYLQKMRFGQRIRYSCDASAESREVLVPSFALQPLVENAIIHGLSKTSKGGNIYVRCWVKDHVTWISVADTGEGIEEDRLLKIRESIDRVKNVNSLAEQAEENHRESATGIGLGNIAERIHEMFPDGGIRIYSRRNCGTIVQIYLR